MNVDVSMSFTPANELTKVAPVIVVAGFGEFVAAFPEIPFYCALDCDAAVHNWSRTDIHRYDTPDTRRRPGGFKFARTHRPIVA